MKISEPITAMTTCWRELDSAGQARQVGDAAEQAARAARAARAGWRAGRVLIHHHHLIEEGIDCGTQLRQLAECCRVFALRWRRGRPRPAAHAPRRTGALRPAPSALRPLRSRRAARSALRRMLAMRLLAAVRLAASGSARNAPSALQPRVEIERRAGLRGQHCVEHLGGDRPRGRLTALRGSTRAGAP